LRGFEGIGASFGSIHPLPTTGSTLAPASWWLRPTNEDPHCGCVIPSACIDDTPIYYRLPLANHKNMKSTNMMERLNQEIKRRTQIVQIFPNADNYCLGLPVPGGGAA
jgi:hypothetical protein